MRRIGYLIDQIDLHGKNNELVDELVALSTQYGVVTPYTSFLADDDAPTTVSGLRNEAIQELRQLDRVRGRAGVAQRRGKQIYKSARSLAQVAPQAAKDVWGGESSDKVAEAMRQVGSKTFYRKRGGWVDSAVKDQSKARVIEQFSDEFFDIARGQSAQLNQYLIFNEEVTVELEGQTYRIVPSQE